MKTDNFTKLFLYFWPFTYLDTFEWKWIKIVTVNTHILSRYHTKIRPKTEEFLEKISKLFELHIVTFGARMYAHTIAQFLDPGKKYFSHRILSRQVSFSQKVF